MTVIAEQTSTVANAINAIAEAAIGLAEWEDADTNVVVANDSSKPEWYNNGRALFHSPSGQYLAMHPTTSASVGLVFNVSSDWNTTEGRPSGNTTVSGEEPYAQYVSNHISDSFSTVGGTHDEIPQPRCSITYELDENSISDIYEAGQLTMDFFASVGPSHLTVGLWRNDGTGCAGAQAFEHVDSKFWADGNSPWAQMITGNMSEDYDHADPYYTTSYGWSHTRSDLDNSVFPPFSTGDPDDNGENRGFEPSDWGFVNPSSNDDTFFFKNAIIYETKNTTTPVAYADSAIANSSNGGAHGDTVTYDGTTYRVIRQQATQSDHVSMALRYE